MSGVIALRSSCNGCEIAFGNAEKRVRHEGKDYHEDCARKIRRDRVKDLFLRNAASQGLSVVPKHHISQARR